MTTSKWIVTLGVMVLVIFVVTFLHNYDPAAAPKATDESADDSASELPQALIIPIKQYPYLLANGVALGNLEWEYHRPGFEDYWFLNRNDEPLRLGAVSKSCKCQGVEVFVLPEGAKDPPLYVPPSPLVAAGLGLLGRSGLEAYVEEHQVKMNQEAAAETHVVLNPDDPKAEIRIPPHRIGWIRMKWTGEKAGPMNLTAKLWMHHPNSGLEVELERKVNFLDPVLVAGNGVIGTLRVESLPQNASFYVWSSTRKSFNVIEATAVLTQGLLAESDPFVVGKPVALTTAQCASVARDLRSTQMVNRVLCAYRIPVTLQKHAEDSNKTPFELGNFRRRVDVKTDASDATLSITFTGVVQGDLQISRVDESGGVSFGSFRRNSPPPPQVVFIRGDAPGLKLELDKDRVPPYLHATLGVDPAAGGEGKTWRLEISVLPKAYGNFPRDNDPDYRDSAVHLHTTDASPQRIRISVRGDAGN
jgi:hypothetical protein